MILWICECSYKPFPPHVSNWKCQPCNIQYIISNGPTRIYRLWLIRTNYENSHLHYHVIFKAWKILIYKKATVQAKLSLHKFRIGGDITITPFNWNVYIASASLHSIYIQMAQFATIGRPAVNGISQKVLIQSMCKLRSLHIFMLIFAQTFLFEVWQKSPPNIQIINQKCQLKA